MDPISVSNEAKKKKWRVRQTPRPLAYLHPSEHIYIHLLHPSRSKQTYKNLNDVKGDDAATKIASAIEESPVVVIGKSTCPFTIEARETFRAHGVPAVNYDVDNIAGGGKDGWMAGWASELKSHM